MAKEWAKPFYNSARWKRCRASYIDKVNGLCERCLKEGRYNRGYIVHHKNYLTPNNINDPLVTLNHANLEYLCKPCHDNEHFERFEPTAEGLQFDKDGFIVEKNSKGGEGR